MGVLPGLGRPPVSRRRTPCLSSAVRTELNFCEAGSKMVAKPLGGAGPFWKGDLPLVTGVGIQGQLCTHEVGAHAGGSGERLTRTRHGQGGVGGAPGPKGCSRSSVCGTCPGTRVTCHHHEHPGPCGQLGRQRTRLQSSPQGWCGPCPPAGSRAAGAVPRVPGAPLHGHFQGRRHRVTLLPARRPTGAGALPTCEA